MLHIRTAGPPGALSCCVFYCVHKQRCYCALHITRHRPYIREEGHVAFVTRDIVRAQQDCFTCRGENVWLADGAKGAAIVCAASRATLYINILYLYCVDSSLLEAVTLSLWIATSTLAVSPAVSIQPCPGRICINERVCADWALSGVTCKGMMHAACWYLFQVLLTGFYAAAILAALCGCRTLNFCLFVCY